MKDGVVPPRAGRDARALALSAVGRQVELTTHFAERIAVEVDGEGDAVLMVHGLGGTSNTLTALAAGVRAHEARAARPCPGPGGPIVWKGALSIARFVQAALRALAVAGVERAHVVGHSMGTIVAAHLAAEHPKVVRSLALFGPLLAPPDPARANLRARGAKARAGRACRRSPMRWCRRRRRRRPRRSRHAAVAFVRESLMRQPPDGYARTCEALADAQPADAARIGCPDAARHRRRGRASRRRRRCARWARRSRPAAPPVQVEVLRGCGHWTPVEMPDECAQLLRAHYARRIA